MSKILQLLRNTTTIYSSYADALAGLKGKLEATGEEALADGSPILARYTENGEEHTLLGIKSASGYEIFDNAGSNKDIEDAIKALNSSASQSAGTDGLALSVTQTDGKITTISGSIAANTYDAYGAASSAVAALDAEKTSTDGTNVQVKVTEVDGKITAVNITTDNTVNNTDITNAINALEVNAIGAAGKVITSVSEANGLVDATATDFSDVTLGGYAKTNDTGDIAAADSLEKALSKLENKTAAITVGSYDKTVTVTNPAGGGTDLAVNIDGNTLVKDATYGTISSALKVYKYNAAEVAALGTNVNEAYQLQAGGTTKGTAIGEVIKIYKDSSLVNIYLGHTDDRLTNADAQGESSDTVITNGTGDTALVYVVQLANGKYKLAAVNVESFLQESEFSNGLEVNSTNHTVSVKIDSDSESFLTVGSSGVKLSGVQNAINSAVADLDSSVSATAASGNVYSVLTGVTETDGKLTGKTEVTLAAVANTGNAADLDGTFDCGEY